MDAVKALGDTPEERNQRGVPLLPPDCCDSCHEDASEGWHPLSDIEWRGEWWTVCCRVARRIHEAGGRH